MVELGGVVHDLHGAAAEHVGGPDYDGISDVLGDGARLGWTFGDATACLPQPELVEQLLEAVAVLRQVDGIRRSTENGYVRCLQCRRQLERRLPAELHD